MSTAASALNAFNFIDLVISETAAFSVINLVRLDVGYKIFKP